MKLIELLKRKKIVKKRMESNILQITKYSSMLNTEKPLFTNAEIQREEVKSLVQSNIDLAKELQAVQRKIEKMNLITQVTINGETYSIIDLLILNRGITKIMKRTYEALNDTEAKSRLGYMNPISSGSPPYAVHFYSEEEKNKGIRRWQDLEDNISPRLEIVNATTDVVED